ncbi:YugN-like family protein [Bacillus sp. T33-2]|uniref:YugN-like family protein n=1 Tax=Bacillus sp. T33-2 TaxID=2054168 RepID=UPI000C788183|nr:YugN-like family protein [Bacillus sp. T33-2]PLR92696.1 hypothetical protein CVD19_20725 [Bacillus sp. T33-2]
MIDIPSKIEAKHYDLYKLEQLLKPLGYSIGGNWEYDHGSFDYEIDDRMGYLFLRLPFKAIDGQLDSHGCTVELQRPFLISHVYEPGLDNQGDAGSFSAAFNQFAEPVDKDGTFPGQNIEIGRSLVKELEAALL